jgi:hypothetical protein
MSHSFAKFLSSFLDKITLPLIFSCAFAFVVRFSNKISPPFLPQFFSLGCYENVTTFHFGFLAILPQFAHTGCNEIVTTFMIEKPTSQGMARPCFWKWGGHQTDSKPASVLTNKPQERWKTGKIA